MLSGSAALAAGNAGNAGTSTSWHVVASPNAGNSAENTLIQVSARTMSDGWAVGYAGSDAFRRTLTEHWNGKTWRVVASPNPGNMTNILTGVRSLTAINAWAVGYAAGHDSVNRALIEHWNGKTWRSVPAKQVGKPDSQLFAVTAISPRNIWAVGQADTGNFRFRPLIEHWNGRAWSVVAAPSPKLSGSGFGLTAVSAVSATDIWAVGSDVTATGARPLAEHWNGRHWSLVNMPAPTSARISGVSMLSARNGWAVGNRLLGSANRAFVEHWNGKRWAPASSPEVISANLSSVKALTPSLAWAVGYAPAKTGLRTLVERWNGHSWSVVNSPNRGSSSELLGLGGNQQRMWAVGTTGKTTLTIRR